MTQKNTKEIQRRIGHSKKMDVIGCLPVEIAQKVFLELTPADIYRAINCNPKWKNKMSGGYFWKRKCQLEDYDETITISSSDVFKKISAKYSNHWQSVYLYNEALWYNWSNKKYKEYITKCPESILKLDYVDDEYVVMSTPRPPRLILYSLTLKKTSKVFFLNFVSKWIVIMRSGDYLIYTDRILYMCVWNIKSGELLFRRFLSIENCVHSINVYRNLLGVIHRTGFLCVFNMDSGKIEYTTKSFSADYLCFANERMASTAEPLSIQLMNLHDKSVTEIECCEKTQFCHDIKLLDDHLISLCTKLVNFSLSNFCVWKIGTNNKLVHRIQNFYLKYNGFKVRKINRVIFETNNNCKLEVWDFSGNGTHLFTIDHKSCIWNSFFNDHVVIIFKGITSTTKQLNSVYCLKTGRFLYYFNTERTLFSRITNSKFVFLSENCRSRTTYLHSLDFEKTINTN